LDDPGRFVDARRHRKFVISVCDSPAGRLSKPQHHQAFLMVLVVQSLTGGAAVSDFEGKLTFTDRRGDFTYTVEAVPVVPAESGGPAYRARIREIVRRSRSGAVVESVAGFHEHLGHTSEEAIDRTLLEFEDWRVRQEVSAEPDPSDVTLVDLDPGKHPTSYLLTATAERFDDLDKAVETAKRIAAHNGADVWLRQGDHCQRVWTFRPGVIVD
jgi:hypothetical protein